MPRSRSRRYVPYVEHEVVRLMEVSQPAEERIVDAVIDMCISTFVFMLGTQLVRQLLGL